LRRHVVSVSRPPRLRLLRFENLAAEFRALTRALNLPVESILPHRNQTADVTGLRRLALSMCSENSPFGVSIITTLASFSLGGSRKNFHLVRPRKSFHQLRSARKNADVDDGGYGDLCFDKNFQRLPFERAASHHCVFPRMTMKAPLKRCSVKSPPSFGGMNISLTLQSRTSGGCSKS
jgi:hypothetical protein